MRPVTLRRIHLTILLVYALLAVLLTWPTVSHVAAHLPGDGGDDPAIAWNLWWVKHALLNLRTNPLYSDFMFYPVGVNLAFYTLTVLNALTALPLTLSLGVTTASNLHLWFTMAVGGYGTFLLARYWLATSFRRDAPGRGASIWAAALAGGFYTFASSQLFYVSLGQFNIASSHWVPYTILFILKSRRDLASLRWPALAALFLTMQAWAEMTYASFLFVFIALYIAYEFITYYAVRNTQYAPRTTHHASRVTHHHSPISNLKLAVRNLLLLALLFTLGISPLLAAMLPDMRADGDIWVQGSGFAEDFSADLLGFLVPTMRHPLFGGLVSRTGIQDFDKGQHIYLGFTLLVLAAVGLVGARRRRGGSGPWFWLIAALFFAWLALGPTVHVNGRDTGIPGPFILLQSLPFFKGNRYPSRYSVPLVLSLAMLAALGIEVIRRGASKWWAARGGRRPARGGGRFLLAAVSGALALLFLFEHLSTPVPQSDMTVPPAYDLIAADPGEYLVLDIPVAWRNGFRVTGPLHPGFMFGQFYQTAHNRRLLQGNTSRNPEFKFQYFTEAPVINSILALETGHQLPPERWETDRLVAGDVLRFFDIGYIVVRPGPGDDPAVTPEATLLYVEAVMPVELIYSDPTLALYHVTPPPLPHAERVEVSAAAPLARLYLGEGWGALVDERMEKADGRMWAQREDVRLYVPLDGEAQEVTLRLFAPGEGQRLAVGVGGWRSPPLPLRSGWAEYALTLPAEVVDAGLNQIQLHFDRLYPASSLVQDALLVQSAGEEVGDFGHIYVDGVDVSPNGRGYNVAVFPPEGEVLTASFDTHLDPGASTAMAEFIAAVPEGHAVAVAVADEASMNLGEEAVLALRSIGASGDLRERSRWSHAIIGVKGAEPGSALEALDGLRPVSVAIGPPLTEPTTAAALDWIRFESSE
jgi:hypothetical protein